MASGTLTSRILGLLRDIALGALFDRGVTDAWTAAFRLPNFFRRLLGEGSLAVSFIPVFVSAQAGDASGERGRNLINAIYSLMLLIVGGLTLLGVIYVGPLFQMLLSEAYQADTARWELTLRLGRIMFGFVFFVSSYAFNMAILNALGSFGLPALAPALLNISMLVFTFLPPNWFPQNGDGLAWGVFVGGLLQALLLAAVLKSRGYLPGLSRSLWSSDVQAVMKNLLPGLIGMGLLQFSTLVNLYFASSLSEGAISYIYWADRLLELPLSLISVSLGAALLPTLSRLAEREELQEFRQTAQESFLMNLFLAWPAALGLYLLAEPIVSVLFLRGRFTIKDVEATALVVKVYALSLPLISCSRVLMPLYYARKNTWFPMAVSLGALLLHVLLAPRWMQEWGLQGLLYSGLVAALASALALGAGLRFWSVGLETGVLLRGSLRLVGAGLCMSAVIVLGRFLEMKAGRGPHLLSLGLCILLAISVYLFAARILACEQALRIHQWFRPWIDRLRRKG